MSQVRNEIYDGNGLVRVEYIEVDEPTQEELVAQKESELLAVYAELQALKDNQINIIFETRIFDDDTNQDFQKKGIHPYL